MHCSKAIVKTPFGHIRGVSGMDRERDCAREEEETTKTAGLGNTHGLFLCVLSLLHNRGPWNLDP